MITLRSDPQIVVSTTPCVCVCVCVISNQDGTCNICWIAYGGMCGFRVYTELHVQQCSMAAFLNRALVSSHWDLLRQENGVVGAFISFAVCVR